MLRTGLAFIIAIAAITSLSGCGGKNIPGVLMDGAHVPPPPSEAHRGTSRVAPFGKLQQGHAVASQRLRIPVK